MKILKWPKKAAAAVRQFGSRPYDDSFDGIGLCPFRMQPDPSGRRNQKRRNVYAASGNDHYGNGTEPLPEGIYQSDLGGSYG